MFKKIFKNKFNNWPDVRVVKEFDLRSNGSKPHGFDPHSGHIFYKKLT